jgi:polyprenyldihydroxybenzoate methyltransferase/3-demethylubiquinol 3-O-methyltransferase
VQRCLSQSSRAAIAPRTSAHRIAPAIASRTFSTTPSTRHNPSASTHTGTVDPTEVSHFNALASSWWDPHGPSRLLHLMNPLRHSFINTCRSSSLSATPTQKLRYLDIGCGGGIFAESAARLPHTTSVTAIDPTPEVLKIAEGHKRRDPMLMQTGKLSYLNTSIEDLPRPGTPADAFDIVTLFEVIEHVNAPGPFLEHVLPHVKPGGWLILSTIARTWTSWVITNVMAEDVLGIVPKGTHEWSKYVNEEELRSWFAKKEGWGEVKTMGVVYVPGVGWREVRGGEQWGNYFLGVRRDG